MIPMALNKKNQATLADIFEKPTRADIKWSRIEKLVIALGGVVEQRKGSKVSLQLNGVAYTVHSPHPQPDTKKWAVEKVREFLVKAEI